MSLYANNHPCRQHDLRQTRQHFSTLTALAELMPPPYPGMTAFDAMYVSEMAAPPGFMIGPNRCSMDT